MENEQQTQQHHAFIQFLVSMKIYTYKGKNWQVNFQENDQIVGQVQFKSDGYIEV